MLDPDICIGLSGPEFEFPIELGKQREFAAAVHAFQPQFHEGSTPLMFPTLPIIGNYIWGYMPEEARGTALEQMGMDGKFAFDGEQAFVFHDKLPRAGDVLVGKVTVEDVWRKSGKRSGELIFYRTRTDYHDKATGRLKLSNYSTSIMPAKVPDRIPHADPGTISVHKARNAPRDQFAAIRPAQAQGLSPGMGPGPITMPPHTLTDCVTFQITAGNYGPGHHDSLAAQAMGFPTWFGIGMYHASLLATYAVSWLPAEALRRFSARFVGTSWPGDVITYRGEVAAPEPENRDEITLVLGAERAPDDPIIKATASFSKECPQGTKR